MDVKKLIKGIEKIYIGPNEPWARWRQRNKEQYNAWANSKYTCPHCKKKHITRKKKYQHERSKKCQRARGLIVKDKTRKTRSDKGTVKVKS